ncbi:MAG: SLBB domain-containing protein [Myxococcales bacterium]|nr:SLBB domain-containing protein [Myxococcales bacterium]
MNIHRQTSPFVRLWAALLSLMMAVPAPLLAQGLPGGIAIPPGLEGQIPPEFRQGSEPGSDFRLPGNRDRGGEPTVEEVPSGPPKENPDETSAESEGAPSKQKIDESEDASKKLSRVEDYYLGRLRTTSDDPTEIEPLRQFGYDIFRSTVSTFSSLRNPPVGADYMIGPGDRFRIFLWGSVNKTVMVTVDPDGSVTVPPVGTLQASGLTLGQFRTRVRSFLSQYYGQFDVSITLDQIRTIGVYVVGNVVTPGSYTVSSLATAFNALFAAGGPARTGSMRAIQIIRENKIYRTIDLYEFLLTGKKPGDVVLQSEDTIFVPPIGPTVAVVGNVQRPAIYEILPGAALRDALEQAGGITPLAFTQRVSLERVLAHDRLIAQDFDLGSKGLDDASNVALGSKVQDRDLIQVRTIAPMLSNVVYLRGHVIRPGAYEFKAGMHVRDVIASYADLLADPFLEHAEIRRFVAPDYHEETLSFRLGEALQGDDAENLELAPGDRIRVFSRAQMGVDSVVSIGGKVRNPGRYKLLEGMRVRDLVYASGNVLVDAFLGSAEVTRYTLAADGSRLVSDHFDVNLLRALADDPKHNVLLRPFDHVLIREIPDFDVENVMVLGGEFRYPGRYPVQQGERLSSLIERAGGFTDRAYLPAAKYTRESVKANQRKSLDELIDRQEREILVAAARRESILDPTEAAKLADSLKVKEQLVDKLRKAEVEGRMIVRLDELDKFRGTAADIEVQPGDRLSVPMVPTTVTVLGEVYNKTSVLFENDNTVGYFLDKVGGPTPNADEDQMFVIRADGSVLSATQNHGGLFWQSNQKSWVWGSFTSIVAEPGDTIVVPEDLESVDWIGETKDITTILFQLATAVGVVLAGTR